MPDIDHLRQLVAFADKGTLSGTARELHMSQPAVSRTMQRLETEFKVDLFDRSNNGIALNDNGHLAVTLARHVIEQYDSMLASVRQFDARHRSIVIAACAPVPMLVIRRMIERLYPSVPVRQILDGDDALLMRMLVSGDCQLIVLNHPISDKGLTCVPFMRESLTLAVPKGHILERFEALHFSDFNGYNIVLNPDIGFWMDVCRRHLPASHLLVQRTSDAFDVIAENSDIFYFSTSQSRDYAAKVLRSDARRTFIPIVDSEATATYYAVCRIGRSPSLTALMEELGRFGIQ